MTPLQLRGYRDFLSGEQTTSILDGRLNMLYGVDALRKLCNHPDLLSYAKRAHELTDAEMIRAVNGELEDDNDGADSLGSDDEGERERRQLLKANSAERNAEDQRRAAQSDGGDDFERFSRQLPTTAEEEEALPFGAWQKSAKLRVLDRLLHLWHGEKRKVLLFAQTRQMLDIVEAFVRARQYEYRRMDGTTPIGARQRRIDEFNNDPTVFAFVLTTKVGGLGVNLIGADRIVIIDPDW